MAGERGEAKLLLPPGVGVHTWQIRPGDIFDLASSDLFIFVGADLEPWVPGLLKAATVKRPETLEASAGIPLLGEGDAHEGETGKNESHDPHVWLDFEFDIRIVDRIEAALSQLDPEGREEFRSNAARLKERLRDLDSRFRKDLEQCRGKHLVVAGHGAFGYLAKRYGLIQKAVYGMSPDSLPRSRQFMTLIDLCRKEDIHAVFFENSVPQDTARVLAKETGARILLLNAGHNLTEDQLEKGLTFFDLMEENLKNLVEGLCSR